MKSLFFTGIFALSTVGLAANTKAQDPKMSTTTTQRDITPSAIPSTATHNSFFFTGDFIYWTANEDGLCIGETGVPALSTPVSGKGKLTYIDFDYDPGFKFGIGADLMYDGWDTYINYTWFANTDLKAEAKGPNLQSLYFQFGDSASAKWNLYFNNIDWNLGRKFWVSEHLTLHPHIGLKGAWLHQNLTVLEERTFATDRDSYAHTYQKVHSWGIGLRGGLDTEWFVVKGLSIYGNLALAELYQNFHSHSKQIALDPEHRVLVSILTENLFSEFHQVIPIIELALGVRYERSFGDQDWYRFMIQAGWEQQVWWNQNAFLNTPQSFSYLQTGSAGNLTLQGLDIKVGFAF